ncbi:MAG: cell division protein FtsI (penicillin-binding protein 3) [Candidatus Peregrinibacteria bacterium Gr01-1014_25]|nr:MAG: cell division protein FtsI (penicillin-binding protein 3) [Candidatus Peregrinibacteria bacterium Gr01-1014_25]
MLLRAHRHLTETQRKRSLLQRMTVVHGILLVCFLLIVARLVELQVVSADEYSQNARHGFDRLISARRGDILSRNSKTNETSVLATNTTLDLAYVDPLLVDDPVVVAETLADTILTPEFHALCSAGSDECPRELANFYAPAFDPLTTVRPFSSGALLDLVPPALPPPPLPLPDLPEARRLFAREIERRISTSVVTDVALIEGGTRVQLTAVDALHIPGVRVDTNRRRVSANPEEIDQSRMERIAEQLSPIIDLDAERIVPLLRRRDLRYVPIMRHLPPHLSLALKEIKLQSSKRTQERRAQALTPQAADDITDPLRCVALIAENWRYYPDGTIASQVVGFLNLKQEAQYGVERTFDPQLRGQKGVISMVSDRQGRHIVTAEQTIVDPQDGDAIVLTIDPFIQQNVEQILQDGLARYQADSAQAIVMDPQTGRILAMVNAPLFSRDSYSDVYRKEAIRLPPEKERDIAVEIYDPDTNVRVLNAYLRDLTSVEARALLPEKKLEELEALEALYTVPEMARYFLYLGQSTRIELFPTTIPNVWLKYRNTIGVGAYLNRTIQAIYEPGSVLKPITMAIALDQGEVTPDTIYDDDAPVVKDEKNVIKNALRVYYGNVTMSDCLAFSINTCMTSVSDRLGKRLFHRMLERFGFGRITGIELEDEQPGSLKSWRTWSDTELATIAFGQGISSTPLQMITAFAALANGGKLMKPIIIDHVIHADGTVEPREPTVVEQVITPQASRTITAMLVMAVENGYAKTAKVYGYRIAGKTGTSQIAGPGGKYEEGTGSTIASFMGYAPMDNPRFIVLVKFDRPKNKEISHGAASAAPVFKQIAAFLFKYYGIPPDDL